MMRFLVLAFIASIAGCSSDMEGVALPPDFECRERPDDNTGFLRPTCEYLATHLDHYEVDPNTLAVVELIPGESWTRTESPFADADHVFAGLSCCFTGDWVAVHEPTSSVVELILGDR